MYQVIYREFRPKTFGELIGQEHVTKILANQVIRGNIGHAYLFSGTRGTGKTSAAKIFSRAVNCLEPVDGSPCNKCEVCKSILEESIMDVIEMDAASNRKIEDIRDLKEKVIYPPSKGKYKVYIIDEVHMLTNEAFNALLKTLEEPPKHLLFILATTEPERLPATILSRCQRFDFKRLKSIDIIKNMERVVEKRSVTVEKKVLELISKNSDGAMRDALSLLDQCISFGDSSISYEQALNILGIADVDVLFSLSESIHKGELDKTMELLNSVVQDGKDMGQFLKDLIHHYRNLMIVKTTQYPDELIDWGDIAQYQDNTRPMSLKYILECLDILTSGEASIRWSTQPRIVLEMTLIRMVNLQGKETMEAIKEIGEEKPSKSKEKLEKSAPFEKPKVEEIEPKQKETVSKPKNLEDFKKDWHKITQSIKKKKMSLYAILNDGQLENFDGNRLTLTYKEGYEFHKDAINKPDNKKLLEEELTNTLGKPIEILAIMEGCIVREKEAEKPSIDKAIDNAISLFGEDLIEIE